MRRLEHFQVSTEPGFFNAWLRFFESVPLPRLQLDGDFTLRVSRESPGGPWSVLVYASSWKHPYAKELRGILDAAPANKIGALVGHKVSPKAREMLERALSGYAVPMQWVEDETFSR